MPRRDGTPLWVDDSSTDATAMIRADLRGTAGQYDEAWLQDLLHRMPSVIPIEQIEPGFGRLIPLCRELPLTIGGGRSGALDNIYVTPGGGLVLIEAKLWRNPEARRSVVAQAMEYAAAVFRLTYEELQTAVLRARSSETQKKASLFEIASSVEGSIDESEFVDAISRNLRRGRAIVAIVGDGIREDIAPLAELLQSHAGHRFTFALIELAVYQTPHSDVRVIIPSVLAQTALIERGVVYIDDSQSPQRVLVREPATSTSGPVRDRAIGIGEDEFYEILDQRTLGSSALVKSLLSKAEEIGVYADRQSGLNLKHASPAGHPLNLGTIDKGGFIDTAPATWWGRTQGLKYNQTLATLIGGHTRDIKNGQESAVRTAAGKMPRVSDFLPKHEEAWLNAMETYTQEMFAANEKTSS